MQSPAATSAAEPRAPGFLDMAPPLVIAPVVAAVIFGAGTMNTASTVIATILAAGTVLLVGWPMLFWMLDNAHTGALTRTIAGLVCGAAPLVAALISGILGLYIRSSNLDYVRQALGYGASVPVYGVILWPRFGWLLFLGMLTGLVTMWIAAAVARAFKS